VCLKILLLWPPLQYNSEHLTAPDDDPRPA
jgi:hypothetical protein